MNDKDTLLREPIAIIGIGCRFPGGITDPDTFWNLLKNEVDAITEVPSDRWSLDKYYDPERSKPGKTYTRCGGFLERMDQFDASFFGVSPREASFIDPQQRLLMEVCWEAFEDAGLILEDNRNRTGVFIGGFTMDYKYLQFQERNREIIDSHTAVGAMMTLLANRLSYVFDFQGPSLAVDTACSSSLVAVHLACQSIWSGESTVAVAGGVNLMLKPDITIAESKAGMLSPDGRSKAFDSRANGYVRGEGAGIVLLKPYSQALADGDSIYALIRGTAVNQDGHSAGLTVPRGEAQQTLMREAYANAGVLPSEIQYVEAHGTGTPVGDPIEANALGTVLSEGRRDGEFCYIGSVKTNFGHTEAAAGIAGLIKAALSIQNAQIPKHLHLINPNPGINFEQLKIKVPQTLTEWRSVNGTRLAGINSFGFGGTNAHIVIQNAPSTSKETSMEVDNMKMIPITARSTNALEASARTWLDQLRGETWLHHSLQDIAYTASSRRTHHQYRLAIVAHSKEELTEKLEAFLEGESLSGVVTGNMQTKRPPSVFVYTGMGPQWWGMGQQLYKEEPVFREVLHRCDELFTRIAGWSLLQEMLKEEKNSRMSETEVAQPANFFIQVALTELWRARGIVPDAIVGHSAGEAAAAYAAGAMTIEEAIRVIYHRSRLQQMTTGQGKLVAVSLSEQEIKAYLNGYEDRVSIAAVNSPTSVTLVGDPLALEEVIAPLEENGVFCKYLFVKVPYHSHYMDPLKAELLDVLSDLKLSSTTIPLYSTVTGKHIDGAEMNAEYWWLNVRNPVYFAAATQSIIEDGYGLFVEIGPHPVLANSIQECLTVCGKQGVVTPSLRRGQDELSIMMNATGLLFTNGIDLEWAIVNGNGNYIKLPLYCWQRERYWNETEESRLDRTGEALRPLLGTRLKTQRLTWESEVSLSKLPYLEDHRIQQAVIFPGAGYIEVINEAIADMYGERIDDISIEIGGEFHKALFLNEQKNAKLQIEIDQENGNFSIVDASNSKGNQEWPLLCSGTLRINNLHKEPKLSLDELRQRVHKSITKEECYTRFRKLGLEYGPTFQGIGHLWQGEGEALARLELPESVTAESNQYQIHPALFDLMFQTLAAALPFDDKETVYMPTGAENSISYNRINISELWVYTVIREKNSSEMKGDIYLMDEAGHVLFFIYNCRAKSLNEDASSVIGGAPIIYSELKWTEQEIETVSVPIVDSLGLWLLLSDNNGIGNVLADKLINQGNRVVQVRTGHKYEEVLRGEIYSINLDSIEDMNRLLDELQVLTAEKSLELKRIVHMFGLDIVRTEETELEHLLEAERLGSKSVMHIVQSIAKRNWSKVPTLHIVTNGAQAVRAEQISKIGQTSLWGIARVIGHQEHRDIWGGIIDLDPAVGIEQAVEHLMYEWSYSSKEDQVAFRDSTRYVARLQECHNVNLPLKTQMRPDAAYMITGGFGALGLLTAKHLISRGARHLILVGRASLPPRSEWNQLESGSSVASRCAAIKELEALGASIHVAGFDVSNATALKRYVEDYRQQGWPEIRGIIHSAGTSKPQMLLTMTGEQLSEILEPKVQGAWNLHRQFLAQELDFFVLYSSVASLVVSPGQASYSAANEFLDGLARYRFALGLPALSINWGPWGEVGMATQLDLIEFFVKRGNYPIATIRGLEALDNVLGYNRPQVMVTPIIWEVCAQNNYPLGEYPMMFDDVLAAVRERPENSSSLGEEADILSVLKQSTDHEERAALVQSHVQGVVAQVLLVNRIDLTPEHSLTSLGLDSMLALELKGRLDRSFEMNILVVDLMRDPTIAKLSSLIMDKLVFDEDLSIEASELFTKFENLSPQELEKLLSEAAATDNK
ncbi:type I polyketide synthase [Paenibacillus arenosi]|uniref:Type I polyketide synthase n=1 Tax=Paenibacillus arenosi TaxID=2774142 RepID=A0ABR9AXB7_9BACL|nr:type I polyketide synthase [Paenibacillus arenosi]MBD8498536.1 type I polyketide synthase [Paenibacillus arenosi]